MNKPINDCVLVSVDFSKGKDTGVLVVGRKTPRGGVKVINAFQGDEAMDIYNRLITPKNPSL